MFNRNLIAAAVALAFASPVLAQDAELGKIREEIKQMKDAYEKRIQTLEKRLSEAEAKAGKAETAASKAESTAGQHEGPGIRPVFPLKREKHGDGHHTDGHSTQRSNEPDFAFALEYLRRQKGERGRQQKGPQSKAL